MAEVTAKAVMALRDRTDLPMMRCKKALVEAGGDEDKAIEILAAEVDKIRGKRADNATTEGRIFIEVSEDGKKAALVDFQCETAPVASNEGFQTLGTLMAKQLLEGPGAETPEELLQQEAPGQGKTLQAMLDDLVNKIAEKFNVAYITRCEGPVGSYIHHDGKSGALLQVTGEKMDHPVLRDVAMHITAIRPQYATPADVDQEAAKAERDRLVAEAKATGKPDNIIDKIVDGRMKNYYQEQGVLEKQAFAKDETKTVEKVLEEAGYKVKSFTMRAIG